MKLTEWLSRPMTTNTTSTPPVEPSVHNLSPSPFSPAPTGLSRPAMQPVHQRRLDFCTEFRLSPVVCELIAAAVDFEISHNFDCLDDLDLLVDFLRKRFDPSQPTLAL